MVEISGGLKDVLESFLARFIVYYLGLYRDHGKEKGSYYLGFRVMLVQH